MSRKLFSLLLVGILSGISVEADDIRLANGGILSDVRVDRIDADGVVVTPNTAGATATKYGWNWLDPADSARLKAAGAKPTKDEDLWNAPDGLNVRITGKVLLVHARGVLLWDAEIQIPALQEVVKYVNPLDGSKRYAKEAGYNVVHPKEPIFIYGVNDLVDGDTFAGRVCPAPTYSYKSPSGETKTVRAYATSLELAKPEPKTEEE